MRFLLDPFLKMVNVFYVHLNYNGKDHYTHFVPPSIKSFFIRLYKKKRFGEHAEYIIHS